MKVLDTPTPTVILDEMHVCVWVTAVVCLYVSYFLKISYVRILFLVSLLFVAVINPHSVFLNFKFLKILVLSVHISDFFIWSDNNFILLILGWCNYRACAEETGLFIPL